MFRYILLPQVTRIIIPPLTTQYIQIVKNSAVVMLIALEDLTFQTQLIEHQTFRGFEAAAAVTILYLLVVLVIVAVMELLHKRNTMGIKALATSLAAWHESDSSKERVWNTAVLCFIGVMVWLARDLRWEVLWEAWPLVLKGLGVSWLLALVSIRASGCWPPSRWRCCVSTALRDCVTPQ